jgi:hypothetical protein
VTAAYSPYWQLPPSLDRRRCLPTRCSNWTQPRYEPLPQLPIRPMTSSTVAHPWPRHGRCRITFHRLIYLYRMTMRCASPSYSWELRSLSDRRTLCSTDCLGPCAKHHASAHRHLTMRLGAWIDARYFRPIIMPASPHKRPTCSVLPTLPRGEVSTRMPMIAALHHSTTAQCQSRRLPRKFWLFGK